MWYYITRMPILVGMVAKVVAIKNTANCAVPFFKSCVAKAGDVPHFV